nr:MAG: p62 [Citrus leprosis virus C2]
MDFYTVYTFLNLTLGLLTYNYDSLGTFGPTPRCTSKRCSLLPAECSTEHTVNKVVERHVFTANDHYCISLGYRKNISFSVSTLFIGDYDVYGGFECDRTALSMGIVSNRLGFYEDALFDCKNYNLSYGNYRFEFCLNSSVYDSVLTDKFYTSQIEAAAPINTRGVEVFDDFLGFTYYRTSCDSFCSESKFSPDFDFGNYVFYFPLCDNHIPLCYDGAEDSCPRGYSLQTIFVSSLVEEETEKLARVICISDNEPGLTFPAWFRDNPSTYDDLVGNYTINVESKCGVAMSKKMRFSRYGVTGAYIDDIIVVTIDGVHFLTSKFCRDYILFLGYRDGYDNVFSMKTHFQKRLNCDSDGCWYSGVDLSRILSHCELSLVVEKKEALVSTFTLFNKTFGGKVGFIPVGLSDSVLFGYNVFLFRGFYSYSPSSVTLKSTKYFLVKAEAEWYMKLMMFFADDVLKVCFETIFSVLLGALSSCLSFIFSIGGCCFRLVFLCVMDSIIILLCLLPCYCHLGFILCSVSNLIIKLFMKNNCCFGISDAVASSF